MGTTWIVHVWTILTCAMRTRSSLVIIHKINLFSCRSLQMDVPSTLKHEVVHYNCNALSMHDRNTTLLVSGSLALLSILCCTLALATVTIKRLYKKVIYRLAMYQVTATLLQSFILASEFMLIDYNEEKVYYQVSCKAIAVMAQFVILMNLFCISWLTFHLFAFVVFFKDLKRLEWLYISSSVLIPLLVACIPFITDSYGAVEALCYITSLKRENNCTTRPDVVGITEQFTLYYGPAAFLFTVNMIAIFVTTVTMACRTWTHKVYMDGEPHPEESNQYAKALKQILPLVAYPIIHFVLFLAAFSNRIYTAKEGSAVFGFTVAHAATQSLRGFFDGLSLIVHIAMSVKKGSLRSRSLGPKTDHNNATYGSVTPYTSGALTTFPLPNETDVDDNLSPCINK